jgi:predicted lipase
MAIAPFTVQQPLQMQGVPLNLNFPAKTNDTLKTQNVQLDQNGKSSCKTQQPVQTFDKENAKSKIGILKQDVPFDSALEPSQATPDASSELDNFEFDADEIKSNDAVGVRGALLRFCSVFANAAYGETMEAGMKEDLRMRMPLGFESEYIREAATDTESCVSVSQSDRIVVLSFRGTTGKTDWENNLKFMSHDGFKEIMLQHLGEEAKGGEIHGGFNVAYQSVSKRVVSSLKAALEVNGEDVYRVIVTGHSLGGALALLCSLELGLLFGSDARVSLELVTFGQPRVGNRVLMNLLKRVVPCYWRVVNDMDVVPLLPMRTLGFLHGGNLVKFDRNGKLSGKTPHDDSRRDVESETKDRWSSVRRFVKEGVSDHDMVLYCKLCEDAFGLGPMFEETADGGDSLDDVQVGSVGVVQDSSRHVTVHNESGVTVFVALYCKTRLRNVSSPVVAQSGLLNRSLEGAAVGEIPKGVVDERASLWRVSDVLEIKDDGAVNLARPLFTWNNRGKLVWSRKKTELADRLAAVKLQEEFGFKSVTVHHTFVIRMEEATNTLKAMNEVDWVAEPVLNVLGSGMFQTIGASTLQGGAGPATMGINAAFYLAKFVAKKAVLWKLRAHVQARNPHRNSIAVVRDVDPGRTQARICMQEKLFVDRKMVAAAPLFQLLRTRCMPTGPQGRTPKIAICTSGGGYRALVCAMGLCKGLASIGVMDMVSYFASLSGSAWFLNMFMNSRDGKGVGGDSMEAAVKKAVCHDEGLVGAGIMKKDRMAAVVNALSAKYAFEQPLNLVDVYGVLLEHSLLTRPGLNPRLTTSQQVHVLESEQGMTTPFPIYTAIQADRGQISGTFQHYHRQHHHVRRHCCRHYPHSYTPLPRPLSVALPPPSSPPPLSTTTIRHVGDDNVVTVGRDTEDTVCAQGGD